jgi:hypothetical protein
MTQTDTTTIDFNAIDYAATAAAIARYLTGLDAWGQEGQTGSLMRGICADVLAAKYVLDADVIGNSFVGWTRHRGLLVAA